MRGPAFRLYRNIAGYPNFKTAFLSSGSLLGLRWRKASHPFTPHGAPTLALGLNFPFTIPAFYDTNKKAVENVGFQTARLASFLKSTRNKFDNCTGRATFFVAFYVKSLQILSVCRLFRSCLLHSISKKVKVFVSCPVSC